ncbi:MAG: type IV pilus modification protein PilV [Methylophilaceae bacterium]|nr:type IV pilus modification protein PilV [Methyloradius sp.]
MMIRKQQSGVMLLEALIGILIFSVGILAVVGLQAASISATTDAKNRSDASLLANQLIGQMWVSNKTPATLQANFQSDCTACPYTLWSAEVANVLPGVADVPPIVTVTPVTVNGFTIISTVQIVVRWRTPKQLSTDPPHLYSVVFQVV